MITATEHALPNNEQQTEVEINKYYIAFSITPQYIDHILFAHIGISQDTT